MTVSGESPAPDAAGGEPPIDPVIESHERSRRKAPLRWGCGCLLAIGIVAAIAVAVPATIYIVYGILDRRGYERELAWVRDAGDPLTIEELEAYYPTDPAIERTTELWLKSTEGATERVRSKENANILYRRERYKLEFPGEDVPPLAGDELEQAKALVERFRDSFETAHAARKSGPIARYAIHFEKLIGFEHAHVNGLRDLASLLELDAEVRQAVGDVDGAVENVLSILAAAESLRNEPVFVTQLVRAAMIGIASEIAMELVATAELADDRLAELQLAFEAVEMSDGYRRALRGERVIYLHVVRGESPIGDKNIETFAKLPSRDADAAKTLEIYRLAAEATDESLLGDVEPHQHVDSEYDPLPDTSFNRRRYPLTFEFAPAAAWIASAALNAQALANVTAAALACERYRLAHGDWPATLDDLVPHYLAERPVDPFRREAYLLYRVEDDGIVVYSVGRNHKDDGGVPTVDDPSEGDTAVRIPTRKKAEGSP